MYLDLTQPEAEMVLTGLNERFDAPLPPKLTAQSLDRVCRQNNLTPAHAVLAVIQGRTADVQPIVKKLTGKEMYIHKPHIALPTPQIRKRAVRGRKQDDRVIRLLATSNPKREGTSRHKRFACYRDGMTVTEYVNAGGASRDIETDTKGGYISVG